MRARLNSQFRFITCPGICECALNNSASSRIKNKARLGSLAYRPDKMKRARPSDKRPSALNSALRPFSGRPGTLAPSSASSASFRRYCRLLSRHARPPISKVFLSSSIGKATPPLLKTGADRLASLFRSSSQNRLSEENSISDTGPGPIVIRPSGEN